MSWLVRLLVWRLQPIHSSQLWSHILGFQLPAWFRLCPWIHTSCMANTYWTWKLFSFLEIWNHCLLRSCLFPYFAGFLPDLPYLDSALHWTHPMTAAPPGLKCVGLSDPIFLPHFLKIPGLLIQTAFFSQNNSVVKQRPWNKPLWVQIVAPLLPN